MSSETKLWAPPGTDPVVFAVRVPASARSLKISEYHSLLREAMAARAMREGLDGVGVIQSLGPAIGAAAAERLAGEWDPVLTDSPAIEVARAIDLAWEASTLRVALRLAGMPRKGPLEVGEMSEVDELLARETEADLGLEDWAQLIPDGEDLA